MAKICSQCNTCNANKNNFCIGCGASLCDATHVADSKQGMRIKQEQNPIARRILSTILIVTSLLCLFPVIQYIGGSNPVRISYKENENYEANSSQPQDLKELISRIKSVPNSYVEMRNFGEVLSSYEDYLSKTYYPDEKYCTFVSRTTSSQCCNSVLYFVLALLCLVSAILVLTKSPAAKKIAQFTGLTGILLIVFGFLIGYFFVASYRMRDYHYPQYIYNIHTVPQQTVLLLLPMFALMPMMGNLLPSRNKISE